VALIKFTEGGYMPVEYQDGVPVIPCKHDGNSLVFLIPCPYCGKKHSHGAMNKPKKKEPWDGGHRVAECPAGGEVKRGRKWVKVPPEAEKGYFLKVVE
jgi:hypothetical protein